MIKGLTPKRSRPLLYVIKRNNFYLNGEFVGLVFYDSIIFLYIGTLIYLFNFRQLFSNNHLK